jgi:hypothetical protein
MNFIQNPIEQITSITFYIFRIILFWSCSYFGNYKPYILQFQIYLFLTKLQNQKTEALQIILKIGQTRQNS